MLTKEDLGDLFYLTKDVAYEWKYIGLTLGFTDDQLKLIEHNPLHFTTGPTSCFMELISQWLKQGLPDHKEPTLQMFLTALRDCKHERLAYNLPDEFAKRKGMIIHV